LYFIIVYVFSSTKLEKRGVGGKEREGAGGRGEKWPKQCMQCMNEFKKEISNN
jgi:hypothetical protein